MAIKVTYRSGLVQTFIVPDDILAVDFQSIAERVNDPFRKVDFV